MGSDGDDRDVGAEPIVMDDETIIDEDGDHGEEERADEAALVPTAAENDVGKDGIMLGDAGTGELNVRESM